MKILSKLATSLNRRDEVPNQILAKQIAVKKDKEAVKELIELLHHKSKDIQSDSIKVLYEIGYANPSLIAPYYKEFLALLDNKNNRLQWGAMTALNALTIENPKAIFSALSKIISAADNGTVITKDHAVGILEKLGSIKSYTEKIFPLLNEQILKSPVNQLPTYAEKALPIVIDKNKKVFLKTLQLRLKDLEEGTKRKRLEKVIKIISIEKKTSD
jgi:hypothetical protein